MSLDRYVPWQRIDAWSCLGCGRCCSHFRVILRPYEYALLTRLYGHIIVQIDSTGNPCLRKVDGRCIFHDSHGLCLLQPLGMKPLACRVWPFTVHSKPKHSAHEALFVHKGRDYYVYVDRSYPCRGMGVGTKENPRSAIGEIIELYRNPTKPQLHSTSSILNPIRLITNTVGVVGGSPSLHMLGLRERKVKEPQKSW